ncbi:hypothetical protein EN829_000705 [Mesorhizobium sp. M00.F.Ca.ET.186.01.1.1]|nr:hypothetical protein EN829_000705 [Mesorhizobium sp. M00.F.Ca.ET.186.01.1.1]
MNSTGWMHLGVLLLAFLGVVAFVLRRMVLPAPMEGPRGENIGGSSGYNGGHGGHSGDGGHGGGGH